MKTSLMSFGSTLPIRAASDAASAVAWNGCAPGISLMAMSVTMSHEARRSRVMSSMAWPPMAARKPRGCSRTHSSPVNPASAANAACTAAAADAPAWYSRPQLVSAEMAMPPIDVAESAMA
jgi:hypothetical protein